MQEESGSVQTDESAFEAEREAFISGQPKDTCTMSTAVDAMQKAVEAMEKAKEATEVDTPTDAEGSEGESVSEGENTTQTLKDDETDQNQEDDNANQNQTEENADQNQTEGNAENQATDAESQKKIDDLKAAVDAAQKKVDIPDEDVPLSENPETGDAMTATWLGTAAASVAGLFGASRKKRKG